MSWWKVMKPRDHGGLIHGRRRAADDVFEAPDSAMTFDELEGIVERTDAPDAKAKPAKAADKGAPDAGKAA